MKGKRDSSKAVILIKSIIGTYTVCSMLVNLTIKVYTIKPNTTKAVGEICH